MFFNKCKKCGGKKISITTDVNVEIDGTLQRATNVPAKQCVNCGDIIISGIILERLRRYAHDYPANNLDYAKCVKCEDEESAGSQILF